jgi:exopolyphosphatase/guanosine-5'-triphosphate,3'-diphosphate pyrophosphatase
MSGWRAVVDIGSNSARLVVYRVGPEGQLEIWDDVRASLRLAQELDESGHLSDVAIDRAGRVLEDFLSISLGAGVPEPITIATSAVRDAANSAALVAEVRNRTGIEVDILSGDDEARLAFLGAVHGLPVEAGILLDLGGGSIELARFDIRKLIDTWTLPLGSLRVSDAFLRSDPPKGSEVALLEDHVSSLLAATDVGRLEAGESLVVTGGTARNLAKIAKHRSGYPVRRLHGYLIGERTLQDVTDEVLRRTTGRRRAIPGLNADRADSIAGGAIVLRRMASDLGAREMIVSGQGLREGLIYRDRDGWGLPETSNVRVASVRALADRFGTWDERIADRRAQLAEALLATLSPGTPPEISVAVREAAWLLDLGRSIDYYNRFDHTSAIILESDLAGLSHRDLALLSALVRLAGDEDVRFKNLRPLIEPEDRSWVEKGGAVIALADEIGRRVPSGALDHLGWEVQGKVLVIGPVPVGSWRTRGLTERFVKVFGLRLAVNEADER